MGGRTRASAALLGLIAGIVLSIAYAWRRNESIGDDNDEEGLSLVASWWPKAEIFNLSLDGTYDTAYFEKRRLLSTNELI